MPTYPAPVDPVSALTRADGNAEAHHVDHGRVIDLNYNVKAYGAAGNGTSDDTVAIQDTLDAAAGAGGGNVFIPAGTYLISGPLTIATATYVIGAGMVNTVIRSESPTDDIFASTSTTFIGVRDLQIEKRIVTSAGSGFAFTSVANFVLENIRVLAPYNGGTFIGCTPGLLKNIVATSAAGGNWNRGFFFQSCISIHWEGCFINGGTTLLGGANAWFQIDSGCDTFIANHIEAASSSGGGLVIWLTHTLSPASYAPRWIRFNGFLVEGSNGSPSFGGAQIGIRIDDAMSAYFTNGYVASSAIGVAGYAGKDLKFANCEFLNCDQQGVYLNGPDDVTITNCTFSDNSQEATNTYAGLTIGVTSRRVTVRDSYFGDALLTSSLKQKYGIQTSAFDTRVSGNTYENLGTAPVSGVVVNLHGVSVVDTGTLGDNSTDNTAAITRAIASAGVGGTVHFPRGLYNFVSTLTPLEGQHWVFDSGHPDWTDTSAPYTRIRYMGTGTAIALTNVNGVKFSGMFLECVNNTSTVVGVALADAGPGCYWNVFEGCAFKGPAMGTATAIRFTGEFTANAFHTVRDCSFDLWGTAIAFSGYGNSNTVQSSTVHNTTTALAFAKVGADTKGGDNNLIMQVELDGSCTNGIVLADAASNNQFMKSNDDGTTTALNIASGCLRNSFFACHFASGAVTDASGAYETVYFNCNGTAPDAGSTIVSLGYIEMPEISAPAAPVSDRARIYTRDNGAGKTQVVVRFPSGASQVMATEP